MHSDFRTALRTQTWDDHQRVDRLISRLDVSEPDDFAVFLGIHLLAFRAMSAAAAPGSPARETLSGFIDHIVADLISLGVQPSDASPPTLNDIDPMAMEYMLEGSRLGSRLLKARWERTADPRVAGAGSYLSIPFSGASWRNVRDRLSDLPAEDARARKIIDDTRRLFSLFHTLSAEAIACEMSEKAVPA